MYKKYKAVLEKLFTDKMKVEREVQIKKPDGSNGPLGLSVIIDSAPCRISFSSDDAVSSGLVNLKQFPTTLFYRRNDILKDGDIVTVDRYDEDGAKYETYKGKVGSAKRYETHSEAQFEVKED